MKSEFKTSNKIISFPDEVDNWSSDPKPYVWRREHRITKTFNKDFIIGDVGNQPPPNRPIFLFLWVMLSFIGFIIWVYPIIQNFFTK